jgi:mono/diheme cytochrome c family protein
MPPYSANILSDKDAADIYAYLSSIPDTKDPKTIPLLKGVDTNPTGNR